MLKSIPDINFLKEERYRILFYQKRLFIIQAVSFGVLGVYILIFSIVSGLDGYFMYKLNSVESTLTEQSNIVTKYQDIEVKHYFLKEKISETMKILQESTKHRKLMERILSLLPDGVSVKGILINESGDVNFGATTSDFSKLEAFIDVLKKNLAFEDMSISLAEIDRITVNENGLYSFNTIMRFDTKKNSDNPSQTLKGVTN